MTSDAKPVSFLATLDLKDGTRLGFSKIAVGGDGKSKSEPQDKLCANTLLDKSLVVEFRYVGQEGFALSLWGFLAGLQLDPAASGSAASKAGGGSKMNAAIDLLKSAPYDSFVMGKELEGPPTEPTYLNAVDDQDRAIRVEQKLVDENISSPQPQESPQPNPLNPRVQKSTESFYIGVDKFGWILKTKNNGLTFLATIFDEGRKPLAIESGNTHLVYLKSWISKNYIQTYKREDLPDKNWFAWMTDCDGDDAVLKLTVIGIYDADGEIRFLI